MKVSIYINSCHKGHLSLGKGSYGIVLEYILKNGEPYTKEIYDSLQPTTKNKTALCSCIKALEEIKKSCNITLYINNRYVTETINQEWYKNWDFELWKNKGKPIPNAEEWKLLLLQMEFHKINFIYEEETSYTSYLKTKIKKMEDWK